MRLIFLATYHATQTIEQIDDALQSVTQFCGIDTLGGLCLLNDDYHVEPQEETRIDFAIAMKMLARERGMYFHQPIAKLPDDLEMNVVRKECRKRLWEGNYLLVPPGWRFIAPVQTKLIEQTLSDPEKDCNRIYMPTRADKSIEESDAFVTSSNLPSGPYFGKFEELLENADDSHTYWLWSNGGLFKAVVEKV